MDDLVEKALARWPNVPAIAGWLKLSTQGDWLLTGPVAEGLSISNQRILNFIARNYACEADGRYYFQNGPQKAYVSLAYTPWVLRIHVLAGGELMLTTHTGLVCWPEAMFMDEQGRVLIETELGIGLVNSSDTSVLASGLSDGGDSHSATWCVPGVDPDQLISAKTRLRKPKGLAARAEGLHFNILNVESSDVPQRFHFQPNPEV